VLGRGLGLRAEEEGLGGAAVRARAAAAAKVTEIMVRMVVFLDLQPVRRASRRRLAIG
jgi:hypothetical protein